MSDIPNIICLEGVGEFCSDGLSFNLPFSLIQYPAETVIIAKINPEYKKYDKNWKLKGFLSNDKRPIECEHLLLSSNPISIPQREQDWKFMPLNADIIIGNKLDKPIKEAYYPLVSYFEGAFSLTDDRWNVEVINPNSPEQTKSIAKNWQIPAEGLTLHLSHPGATPEQYTEKAYQIARLLSLASGNEVTFHRQIVLWNEGNEVEIWRRMIGGEYGPGFCILETCISDYLREALSSWRTFSPQEQENIRIATTYINLSANGYMDERLLRITQAWEMLANAWGNQTKEVKDSAKDPIKELIAEVNDAYRKWKDKYPDKDEDGFLKSRINEALNWDKVLKKINLLANSYKINTQKIELNFQQLIKARNDVAHDCKMSKAIRNNADSPPYKLLIAAQFGLKILLLKKLGYSGKIVTSKNRWRSYEEISEYIIK